MFDESLVVQSAVSAFNNAALGAPLFMWLGLLMLPLFAMVYKVGNDFIARQSLWQGLKQGNMRTFNFALSVLVLVFAWLILMGGNYGVLRDEISILPYAVSAMLFVLAAVIIENLREINPQMPAFITRRIKHRRLFLYSGLLLVSLAAGLGGANTLWGALMPAAAVFGGAVAGRALRRGPSPILFSTIVMLAVVTLILMQPEFFRFGQLGNLSLVHLGALVVTGVFAAATVVLRNVKPRSKIHRSAYIKLKWMARFVVALAVVLFLLTESVPVFLGMVVAIMLSFALSVWHQDAIAADLDKKMWAALMCAFGIVTIMPVITALGIVYWTNLAAGNLWRQSKFLL